MLPAENGHREVAGRGALTRRLLIRPGALGDFIVSLPALESLRAEYTEVWTTAENAPLVHFASRVDSIAAARLDLLELGLAPESLHQRLASFDDIVSWYGATRAEFRDAAAGLPFRFFPALPAAGLLHAVDFYLAQVGQTAGVQPRLAVAREPRRFVAIHPFSGSPSKNWPLHRFAQVAAGVPLAVEWSAGPGEELAHARRFDSRLELAQWLASAACYLGNDSGVSHLAAAVGTPVVALFGPGDPRVWAPRGDRVRVIQRERIGGIGVEEALSAVLDFI